MMISTLMSGIVRQELRRASARGSSSAACSVAVMRMVPAGFSRSSLSAASSASISSKRGPDGAKQAFARFRRRDAARGAGQQPDAEPRFELADGVAQRRLRDAELRRRLGEAPLPPDGEESDEVIEMSALHL